MKRICATPGCPRTTDKKFCGVHYQAEPYVRYSKEARELYNGVWYRYRRIYLQTNPLCRECENKGKIVLAEVVDHIRPHRGDYAIFWDATNHQPLCVKCHNRKSGAEVVHRGTGSH